MTKHRSTDVLLSDDLKRRLIRARWAARDAVERGDLSPSSAWEVYGLDALMRGRSYADTALYQAAKTYFTSGRLS